MEQDPPPGSCMRKNRISPSSQRAPPLPCQVPCAHLWMPCTRANCARPTALSAASSAPMPREAAAAAWLAPAPAARGLAGTSKVPPAAAPEVDPADALSRGPAPASCVTRRLPAACSAASRCDSPAKAVSWLWRSACSKAARAANACAKSASKAGIQLG